MRTSLQQNPLTVQERDALIDTVNRRCMRIGEITLASGMKSNYYIDIRCLLTEHGGRQLVATGMNNLLPLGTRFVGGLATGAIDVAGAMLSRHNTYAPYQIFHVRKEEKGHGQGGLIVGLADYESLANMPVVVVEDTSTTGSSALKALRALQEAKAKVLAVLTVIDRQDGAAELFKKHKIPFLPLLTAREVIAKRRNLPDGFEPKTFGPTG